MVLFCLLFHQFLFHHRDVDSTALICLRLVQFYPLSLLRLRCFRRKLMLVQKKFRSLDSTSIFNPQTFIESQDGPISSQDLVDADGPLSSQDPVNDGADMPSSASLSSSSVFFKCFFDSCPSANSWSTQLSLLKHLCKEHISVLSEIPMDYFEQLPGKMCFGCVRVYKNDKLVCRNCKGALNSASSIDVSICEPSIAVVELEQKEAADVLNVDPDLVSYFSWASLSKILGTLRLRSDFDNSLKLEFSKCVSLALQIILKSPDTGHGYLLLFALPSLVLRQPSRSRKRGVRRINSFTRSLITRFLK